MVCVVTARGFATVVGACFVIGERHWLADFFSVASIVAGLGALGAVPLEDVLGTRALDGYSCKSKDDGGKRLHSRSGVSLKASKIVTKLCNRLREDLLLVFGLNSSGSLWDD